ncbi:MAG: alkaline phosphatase family protein [Polyangiaceae bacterium]|nr:alkaline phosphatase family protein [Polyangiaceae bacterium]MCW5790225.1 alkaline phosphatase family protein [Polyangiaceae bacterium]
MSKPASVLLLCLLLIAGSSYGVIGVLLQPEEPPATSYQPKLSAPLTKHLLFVIVDGLRYDVATDPERMPRFSEAMRRHTSGEIWAGRVSMTTSAVLSYATGQRGQLEQAVRNLNPAEPRVNSWLANAREAGLTLMAVGDPAWGQMFGPSFHELRPDPAGVAMDVDFNPQTFRDTRELLARQPNVLISHFVTPDHQGHVYGIHSERYRAHMLDYDRQLSELLGEVGPEWTVIVTSDHGATDTGTHGADTPLQRRSPIYAYGPGIAPGVKLERQLDQVDLPGTFAALLGVAAPRESRGHLIAAWLAVPEAKRAAIACEDAERGYAFGRAKFGDARLRQVQGSHALCAHTGAAPSQRLEAAAEITRFVDAEVERAGITSARSLSVFIAMLLAALGLAWFAARGGGSALGFWRVLPGAALLLTVATFLVFQVERLPGQWPNTVRVALFIALNLIALSTLARPLLAARWALRLGSVAPLLVPGVLLVSYPSNTHPHAFVAVLVISIVFCVLGPIGRPERRSSGWSRLRAGPPALNPARLGLVLLALALLVIPGTQKEGHLPAWVAREGLGSLLAALTALGVWAASTRVDPHGKQLGSLRALLFGVLGVALCLVLRRYVPHQVGRAAILLFPLLALVLASRGRMQLATLSALAAFAWVSRDREWLGLVPTLILAEAAGDAWRARREEARDSAPHGTRFEVERHAPGGYDLLLAAAFVFGLLFVQRMAIQGNLNFTGLDLTAGAFRDPNPPLAVVAAAISWKYILAELIVLVAFVSRLGHDVRRALLPALVVMYLARWVALLLQLYFCHGSYWTALRVISDLPFSMTGLLAAALTWWGVTRWEARQA